jgi:hypothetical protein
MQFRVATRMREWTSIDAAFHWLTLEATPDET